MKAGHTMSTKLSLEEVEHAAGIVREAFPRGSTVTTEVTHVARSGMSRSIRVLHGEADGTVSDLSWAVSRVLGWPTDQNNGGIRSRGAGMDMTFHLVYTLASKLYDDGYALDKRTL